MTRSSKTTINFANFNKLKQIIKIMSSIIIGFGLAKVFVMIDYNIAQDLFLIVVWSIVAYTIIGIFWKEK